MGGLAGATWCSRILYVFAAAPRVRRCAGPDLFLDSTAVQNVGFALHELATNASKHGALAAPDGTRGDGGVEHCLSWVACASSWNEA